MIVIAVDPIGRSANRFCPDCGRSPSPALVPLHCAVERCTRYGANRSCAQHRRVVGPCGGTPRIECTSAHDCSTPPLAPPLTTRSLLWLSSTAVPPDALLVRCTSDHRAGHPRSARAGRPIRFRPHCGYSQPSTVVPRNVGAVRTPAVRDRCHAVSWPLSMTSEPGRSGSCLESRRAWITDSTRPDAQASWPCLA